MSLDRRLRQDLSEAASTYAPDVESRLGDVTARGRRSRDRRRAAGGALAGLAIVGGLVLMGSREPTSDVQSAATTTVPVGGIEGRYATTLTADTLGDDLDLAGRWTMDLGVDGSIAFTAPDGADAGTYVFSVNRDVLRTNAFVDERCAGRPNGSYRWRLAGDQLTLVRTSDACTARVAILASATWQRDR